MKLKKYIAAFALVAIIIGGIAGVILLENRNKSNHQKIITTNFVAYDFARAITGDDSNIRMLLKPATESHGFEPTPQDIIDITNADYFIYIGGESDEWVADLLRDNNIDEKKTLRLMDFVELKKEETKEGMEAEEEKEGEEDEEEAEYDEHIWTSPRNAVSIIEAMRDRFIARDATKINEYTDNARKYTERIMQSDQKISDIVTRSSRKELIFADRFPFRYFVDEYGLDYYAAFPGCAEQTEASSKTIAFLVDKVKSDRISVVLKIELTSDNLAQTISAETGAKILTLNAAHNITQEDFDAKKTYADILEDNIKVLEEALN